MSEDERRQAGPTRLFHSVAEQIAHLIDEGVFPPGAKLPGERELADRFGVSRVTIREAEVSLQAIGRLAIKPGSGVYVCEKPPPGEDALPDVSAFELTEARSLFESEAAALAAPIISDAGLERLELLIRVMAGRAQDGGLTADQADREFHLIIASASGNAAIVHTIKTLWRMRTELPDVQSAHEAVCRSDVSLLMDEHTAILNALKDRDPAAARLAMRRHFNRLIEAMLDAAEEKAMSELREKASQSRERFLISTRIG